MKNYFFISVLVVGFSSLLIFNFFSSSQLPRLKVMVYSSFLSPYGPAYEIKKKFEKTCECQLQWMKVEDSTLMIQRLDLRSDGLGVDVVLGLDQMTLFEEENLWKDFKFFEQDFNEIGLEWIQQMFQKNIKGGVPITWAPLTFISKNSKDSVTSLEDLLQPRWENKISLPHPRSSTIGLQFYFWLFVTFEENLFLFLKNFKQQVHSFSHSWSISYGFFQKNLVDLTFSHQTSLMYHLIEEKKTYYESLFLKGHPYQVEFAVIPRTCRECQLSQEFIRFLLQKEVQKILMEKNYMLPIIKGVEKNTPFETLRQLTLISYQKIGSFLSQKKELLQKF